MTTLVVHGPARIEGAAVVPGDRSISHRALMLGAIGSGETRLANVGPGGDVVSMIRCLRDYGVQVDRSNGGVTVTGRGVGSWSPPAQALDCGNSGATMRMLAGLAAHHPFESVLDGDASLRRRPMERVAGPLRVLGARVETTDGHAPIRVEGGALSGTDVVIDVASAQVKSSVLLAALGAGGRTSVTEPVRSRDHTERMLVALGVPITETDVAGRGHRVEIEAFGFGGFSVDVPGDVSSAAFLVAAALLTGRVEIGGVNLNPTRIGFLHAARAMQGDLTWEVREESTGEPVGVIDARCSRLRATTIEAAGPDIHDELPLLAAIATQADGETSVRGAGELRVKESDRIASLVDGLRRLGADIEALPDGFVVRGPTPLRGASVDGAGDHRIAMALAVAGLWASGNTRIEGYDAADVSWPGFAAVLAGLGAEVEVS